MAQLKLFMMMLGCRPKGRHTEQHDVFFSVGEKIEDTFDDIRAFWPEGFPGLHIDAWREVTEVISDGNNYSIEIVSEKEKDGHLFFINLGGYKTGEFNEFHKVKLVVAGYLDDAKLIAKQSTFFPEHSDPHLDDKYRLDVDDAMSVKEILPVRISGDYYFKITKREELYAQDEIHLGYQFLNLKVK